MAMMAPGKPLLLVTALVVSAALSGCGSGTNVATTNPPPPPGNYTGLAFTGKVMAGTSPVIGASVQVYTAGTAGNGSAPLAELTSVLTTDSNGAFSVPAGYTCPLSTSIMFLVATGGRAGASGTSNTGTVLMTSPGACSTVSTGATFVLNEATTVASAYAFGAFLKAGAQMGASSTNSGGITLAAGTFANLVNITTGAEPGPAFPATGTAPTAKLNALANAINACIVAGLGGSACTSLYAAATAAGSSAPSNTLDAVLSVAQHPGSNIAAVYAATLAATAYSPVPTAAPADWTLHVTYTGGGMNDPSALSFDSTGRVWVANYFSVASLFSNTGVPVFPTGITGDSLFNSYGGAVDGNDNFWIANEEGGNSGLGTVTELSSTGQLVTGSPYQSGGIYFPISVAFDQANGTVWIADYGNTNAGVVLLSSTGTPLSGSSGYASPQFDFPAAIGVDSNHNGWVANQSSNSVTKIAANGSSFTSYVCCDEPSGLAIDANDNVWATSYYGNSVSLITAAGTVPAPTGYGGGSLYHPQGIAIDGAGTVWTANYLDSKLFELAGASASSPGAFLSPATGYGTDAGLVGTYAVAIDASGNVWVSNFGNNTLTEFVGMGAPVKTPLLGMVRIP